MKEDKTYKDIINLANSYKSDYQKEKVIRDKIVLRINKSYNNLIKKYLTFAEKFEDSISFIYLDSKGYPTIGCGHLLGFQWSKAFWENPQTQNILRGLRQQIHEKKLAQNPNFRKFDFPEQVKQFFSLQINDYLDLFRIKCVSFGLFDALDLPLRWSQGKKTKQSNWSHTIRIGDRAKEKDIIITFSNLLSLSLMLKVWWETLGKATPNPFLGKAFYDEQDNCLVLQKTSIDELAQADTAIKIFSIQSEIEKFRKTMTSNIPTYSFSQFPLPAQMVLLDLSFNGIRLSNQIKEAAVQLNWKKLQDTKIYGRNESAYQDRNNELKALFKEAEETSQKDKRNSTSVLPKKNREVFFSNISYLYSHMGSFKKYGKSTLYFLLSLFLLFFIFIWSYQKLHALQSAKPITSKFCRPLERSLFQGHSFA